MKADEVKDEMLNTHGKAMLEQAIKEIKQGAKSGFDQITFKGCSNVTVARFISDQLKELGYGVRVHGFHVDISWGN